MSEQPPTTDAKPSRFAKKAKPGDHPREKALKIKVNALKRTMKDLDYAKAEVVRETERLEKFKAENPDKVSQQENVIAEAKMMIPHAENRIRTSVKDLAAFLEKESSNIANEELLAEAQQCITDGENVVQI